MPQKPNLEFFRNFGGQQFGDKVQKHLQDEGIVDANGYYTPGHGTDYSQAAQDTAAASQKAINQQTVANRPNQNSPFSSTQWTQNPDGSWTQNVGLNGPLAGAATGLEGQLANAFSKPMDDGNAVRDQAISAMFGQSKSRLDPMFAQRDQALQSQLANQGLDMHSEAYRNAMGAAGRDRNDAYQSALASAIGMGNQAQATTFGENLQARMAPIQGLQGLQGLSNPYGFTAAGAAQTPDYLGAMNAENNYKLSKQQADQAIPADIIAAGGQIAGAAARASDERLKDNILRTDMEAAPGVPLAFWNYKGDPTGTPYAGVIAQDLEKVAPEHVSSGPDGYKRVSPDFAPQPLGGDGIPQLLRRPGASQGMASHGKGSAFEYLTPQQLALQSQLSTSDAQRAKLQRQLALADAIGAGIGKTHHTSIIGAGLGGIADIISGISARRTRERAEAQDADLTRLQQQGFGDLRRAEGAYRSEHPQDPLTLSPQLQKQLLLAQILGADGSKGGGGL
jgi:hypothetical protein